MKTDFLVNKSLSDKQKELLFSGRPSADPILFAIVGETALDGKYEPVAFAVSATHFFTVSLQSGEVRESVEIAGMGELFTKRLYGNGLIRLREKDGIRDVFRYTFTIAGLCDAAVAFLNSVKDGEAPEEALVEKIALREAIRALPEREQETIYLRFFKCMTQEQAARILGVSQVQVSRLERKGVTHLREMLRE